MMRVDGFRAPLRNDCQVGKILHQGFVFFKGQDNGFPMPFGVGNVLRVKGSIAHRCLRTGIHIANLAQRGARSQATVQSISKSARRARRDEEFRGQTRNSWSVLLGRATPGATFKVEWLSGCLTSIILAGR